MIDWFRLFPNYWFQNYPTCEKWDSVLNEALDEFEPVPIASEGLTTELGPFVVWTGNWPYAYGGDYSMRNISNVLPRVATRRRLRRMIVERQERIQRDALHLAILQEWQEENLKRSRGS